MGRSLPRHPRVCFGSPEKVVDVPWLNPLDINTQNTMNYLLSRTQSTPLKMNNMAMIIPAQSNSNNIKKDEQQKIQIQPYPYSSSSPHCIECRDDFDETTSTSTNRTGRDRTEPKMSLGEYLEANNSMMETQPQIIVYDKNNSRSIHDNSPSFSMLDDGDENYYDDDHSDAGFASQAAGACVACSIPVLHFIKFFMC